MNQKYAEQQRTIEFILTGPPKYEETRRRILYELFGKLNKFEEEAAILPVVPILPKMGHYYNYDLAYHRSTSSSSLLSTPNRSSIAGHRGPFKKNVVPLQPASQASPIYWRTKSREELKKEMTDKKAKKTRISYIKRDKRPEEEVKKTEDIEEGEIVNCDD